MVSDVFSAIRPRSSHLAPRDVASSRAKGWLGQSAAVPQGANVAGASPRSAASHPRAFFRRSLALVLGLIAVCSQSAFSAELDWIAPLHDATWTPHVDWLGNPADDGNHHVERRETSTRFEVDRPGRGMKWSWMFDEPVALEGRVNVAIRYRAAGWRRWSDYAVCVFGRPVGRGDPGYATMIPTEELAGDGRWHTLNVDIRPLVAKYETIHGLAIQVQADAPNASLELADLRLTATRRPARLADVVQWRPDAELRQERALDISAACNEASAGWQRAFELNDWFGGNAITVEGLPFRRIDADPELAATQFKGKGALRLPAAGHATEVYLLLLAQLVGDDEPAYDGGRFRAIRDVDRFRLRIEYAEGSPDECLPMNVATGQFEIGHGVQVVVAAADPSRELAAVVLDDRAKQAAFAVAAVTLRTDGRAFPAALESDPPLRIKRLPDGESVRLEADLTSENAATLRRLIHYPTGWNYLAQPCRPIILRVDGHEIPPEQLRRVTSESSHLAPRDVTSSRGARRPPNATPRVLQHGPVRYQVKPVKGLRLGVDIRNATTSTSDDSLAISATVLNAGNKEHRVSLAAPRIGPYRLGDEPQRAYYFVPRRGAVFDNREASLRERYSGLFPVQFLDTFSPADGRGLSLRTTDTTCLRKHYVLEKEDGLFTIGVEYPERTLKPGQRFQTATAIVTATDGDWRRGLDAYRAWLQTWYRPAAPRKAWFREIFNFRQRFLWMWDPLAEADGTLHLMRAVEEARREFGGIDYLHLFDWGNVPGYGRLYGRTGDHQPFESIRGGREGLRRAIAEVQAAGVPVGLYIEGYLLQERGKLGKAFGKQWQLIGRDGAGRYWPGVSEMYVCPAVDAWQEVQASTYATKLRELNVDGMYVDQFGFAGAEKDCHSADHGHAVPSFAVQTERDCTRAIRRRIDAAKPNVAVYTEETPVDVTSQYQDGSFTYAMFSAQRTRTRVPLNAARFAFPDFKTIEILFCDRPTGSWATGVGWVFFNGEAIWLEGPAEEWFEPATREMIRRCYRILHEHRDAFTTLGPQPLVPTEAGGVYANAFPAGGKTVYTLYNSRHRTYRGAVLRVPHLNGAAYHDAWHARPAVVRREGEDDLIRTELGPHGVGCVVARNSNL